MGDCLYQAASSTHDVLYGSHQRRLCRADCRCADFYPRRRYQGFPAGSHVLYHSGSLKEEDFVELEKKGAVGDVCTCFFNASGEAVSSSFSRRRISLTLEELKKIPCKIGVASGLEKKEALHGALLGGYIDILYADEELGKEILNY